MPTHPVATTLVPVSQIHPNPAQPRKLFDPQAITDLKESIEKRGLINPISIMQRGEGDYLIIAGERRFRAIVELGWKEIDARIWPPGTPASEMELMSLVENVQRKDLSPVEVANGYKILNQSPYEMTQEQLAEQCGQSRGTISQYLMIGNLDSRVQEIAIRIANLEKAHLLQLCRLKTSKDQIAVAQKASKADWSVKELKAIVDKRLAEGKSATGAPAPRKADPLKDIWPPLVRDLRIEAAGAWEVAFKKGKWIFAVDSAGVTGQKALSTWFEQMAEALKAGASKPRPAQDAEPPDSEELDDVKALQKRAKLPQTPEEEAELYALAAKSKGPGPIYARLYGPLNPITRLGEAQTWADFNVSDPKEGVRMLLEGIRKIQSA